MPHVIVKLYPGKTIQQKTQIADKIVRDVVEILNGNEKAISVAIEEIYPEE